MENHCNTCQLCPKSDQEIGTINCKNQIKDKYYQGFWHNGEGWVILNESRAMTLSHLKQNKNSSRYRSKNESTIINVTTQFTEEHENVLREWSTIISGFQREGHIDKYIFHMSTHPFSELLEFRLNNQLIGFDWLIVMDDTVIHQLFPWKKKEFSQLGLGTFGKEKSLEIWPTEIHLFGRENEFKKRFGGWTFEGAYCPQEKTIK